MKSGNNRRRTSQGGVTSTPLAALRQLMSQAARLSVLGGVTGFLGRAAAHVAAVHLAAPAPPAAVPQPQQRMPTIIRHDSEYRGNEYYGSDSDSCSSDEKALDVQVDEDCTDEVVGSQRPQDNETVLDEAGQTANQTVSVPGWQTADAGQRPDTNEMPWLEAGQTALKRAGFMALSTNVRQTALYAVEDFAHAAVGPPVLMLLLRGAALGTNSSLAAWQWHKLVASRPATTPKTV